MPIKQWFLRLSKRQKMLALVVAILLGFAVIDRLIYQPIAGQFEAVDQEIQEQERQLRKNQRYMAARQRILKEYQRYAGDIKATGSEKEEMALLLNEIEGLARQSGLSIINMKPQPTIPTEFGEKNVVDIEVEGRMDDLIKTLHGLYGSKHLLRVEKFRLASQKAGASMKGELTVTKTRLPKEPQPAIKPSPPLQSG